MTNVFSLIKENDIRDISDTVNNQLLPKLNKKRGRGKTDTMYQISIYKERLLNAYDTETHKTLLSSFPIHYQDKVLIFLDNLIKEYNCTTVLEISLATTITSHYFHSQLLLEELNKQVNISHSIEISKKSNTMKLLKIYNKLYFEAILTLKQVKTNLPQINVNFNS
jgi:hypothetical protein